MADVHLRSVIRQLRRIVAAQGGVPFPPDAQLLEAFIHHRDGAAIEMLVWRHGTMVLNLCRRILHDEHQAEDAFQATFLVFVRKASSIGKRQSVGSWLYKTAYRIAQRLRCKLAKLPSCNVKSVHSPERDWADELIWRDVRLVLDEEIDLLPEKYRSPIVLCHLQGHTTAEAAEILGCPKKTLQTRLLRGREQLKSRLIQRGLGLSAGWLAAHLSVNACAGAVPAALVNSTIKAASEFASGKTAVGSSIAILAQEALRSQFLTKLKNVAVFVLLSAALSLGVALVAFGRLTDFQPSRFVERELTQEAAFDQSRSGCVTQPKNTLKKFVNSVGMEFVWIPPGSFMMGSPRGEKQRRSDETQHKVTLTKGFYLGVYLVTQEQWKAIMGENPARFQGEKNLPVDNVSWDDCQEFIKKLWGHEKRAYRLPTEAEWEYACRAGTTTPFHFGEMISTGQANFNGNSAYGNGDKGLNRKKTAPVGSFPANAWGLHDMHGNVWQWCQDEYDDYPQRPVVNPLAHEGEGTRVLRGGSWSHAANACRSANRGRDGPSRHSDGIGVRLCFSPN